MFFCINRADKGGVKNQVIPPHVAFTPPSTASSSRSPRAGVNGLKYSRTLILIFFLDICDQTLNLGKMNKPPAKSKVLPRYFERAIPTTSAEYSSMVAKLDAILGLTPKEWWGIADADIYRRAFAVPHQGRRSSARLRSPSNPPAPRAHGGADADNVWD